MDDLDELARIAWAASLAAERAADRAMMSRSREAAMNAAEQSEQAAQKWRQLAAVLNEGD